MPFTKNSPLKYPDNLDAEILNKLWIKETNYFVGSPYTHIALYLAPRIPLENFIKMVNASFSEAFIHKILKIFKIENKNGVYNVADFESSAIQNDPLAIVTFNDTPLQAFSIETIKEIITLWLGKLSELISTDKLEYSNGDQTLNLMCRFVQWGNSVGNDNRMIINEAVERFLNNKKISDINKTCFAKNVVNANVFNAHFYQNQDDDKIFNELFASTKLKSLIFSLTGK